MKKVNFPPAVTNPLRRKLLIPLLIIGVLLTALAIWTANQRLRQQLIAETRYRAEMIGNMVNYAAEGLSRSGELQRIVTALGAEHGVKTVIVIGGVPSQVLASTKTVYLGKALDDIVTANIASELKKALKTRKLDYHTEPAGNTFDIVIPMVLNNSYGDNSSLVDGAVFVQLDISPTHQAISSATLELAYWLIGLLLILAACGFRLLKRHVIRPVELIAKQVRFFQPGQKLNLQDIQLDDEIGLLAKMLEAQKTELAESEERFRIMANSAPVLVWIAGTDKLCFWFNQAWLKFTGRTMEQEYGNGWAEGVHADDFDECLDTYVSHFDRHEAFKMQYRLKRHDGEYRWIYNTGVPRFDSDNNFLGFIGSCIDITDQKEAESRLYESEQRWNFALAGSGDGVWDWDILSNQITFSKRWYEIQGFDEGSIDPSASAWRELVHPDDLPLAEQALQAHFDGKTPNFSCEHRVRCNNGSYKWILGRGMVVARDALGNPIRAIGTHTDITDRKAVELEHNHMLAIIMEAPDFIASSDMEMHLTFLNPAGAKLVGVPKGVDLAHLMIKDIHPEWASKRVLEEGVPTVLKQGYWQGETALLNKETGQEIPVSQLLLLHRDNKGIPLQLSTIMRDISDRKNLEKALAADKQKFESLFQLSPVGMALVDHETGAFLEVNDAVLRPTGYTREEFLRLTYWEITPAEYEAQEQRQIFDLIEYGKFGPNEKEYINKEGVRYPIMISGFLVTQPDGKKIVWGIIEDITERKKAQQGLIRAKDAAESLAKSKSQFLTNMSHEIRTPMNAIIGLSNLALNKEITDDVRDYLETIHSSSESLLGILNDILDFSKIEAGKLPITHQHFDFNNVVDSLRNLFLHRAEEKGLKFDIEIAEKVPTDLLGDALRLQQILANLLGNAIKFTERGQVTLIVTRRNADASQVRLHFSVCDTGIGMSLEDQAKLFQPFSQIDTSATRRFGGTGLGLVISRNLLNLMGSDLGVDSTQGQGSTFSFELTFSVAAKDVQQAVIQRPPKRKADELSQELKERGKSLSGARILLAEDNRINQRVIKEFLNLSGIQVDVAFNGEEVLSLLEQNHYDAILMDVHMPSLGGIAATEIIRRQPKFKDLPIIAQTAGVTEEERANSLVSGMNDFITKPIKPAVLIEVLEKWIRQR